MMTDAINMGPYPAGHTMFHASTALITGASAGIGTAYADRLACRGCDLVLAARDENRQKALATRLRAETGRSVEILAADLAARPDLLRVEHRLRDDQSIGILVNNAGVAVAGDVGEMVDAALVGLDIGETVTIPPLPDIADWCRFDDARRAMGPNLSLAHAAGRYLKTREEA